MGKIISTNSNSVFSRSLAANGYAFVHTIILLCTLVASPSFAATPPDTLLTNTVTASYALQGTPHSRSASVDVRTVKRTPSLVHFYHIVETGTPVPLPAAAFSNTQEITQNTQLQNIDHVTLLDGSTIALPTQKPIEPANEFRVNEPLVVEVRDIDQNRDATVRETILVTLTVPETGDTEVLRLTETAPDSGVFRGVVDTAEAASTQHNGVISVISNSRITLSYKDGYDSTDTSATASLVEPSGHISLSKKVDHEVASIGDVLTYTLNIQTQNFASGLNNLTIHDTLPPGFRYLPGTAKLNQAPLPANKVSHQGRQLTLQLGTMPALQNWEIRYQVRISAGTPRDSATNTAQATAISGSDNTPQSSLTAKATVKIKDELMRQKTILVGRIIEGCEKDGPVIANARIYLETGQYTNSDKNGFWHMDGISAGTHLLKLDTDSLPAGKEPLLCRNNTQFAGKADSRFVEVKAGSIWRADFHVKSMNKTTQSNKKTEKETSTKKGTSPQQATPENDFNPLKEYGDDYVKTAKPGFEILWPPENYVPSVVSISIAVKHDMQHRVTALLNGEEITALNSAGSSKNTQTGVRISRWRGVDINIKSRENHLKIIVKDKNGKIVHEATRLIHFSSEPADAEYLPDQSTLVADGRTSPDIAVRIRDKEGYPMRANTFAYFSIVDGNATVDDRDTNKNELITSSLEGRHKAAIDNNGIAHIRLKPTTQSGEIRLKIHLADDKYKEIRSWLQPHLRKEWILVGLAEGTVGYNTLKGNMQTLSDLDKKDRFYSRGRVAFFAKGKIKGKYLLTIAYDSAKKRGQVGEHLNGNIDPDAYYTIYGDNSRNQYEATSSGKLFVKLERNQFFALFGDYRTNMTVTHLSRYERTLYGIHTEYRGRNLRYNASLSHTSNKHQREEIPGDGTSGEYKLRFPVIPNSEVVTLETRDRFHPEVILSQRLLAIHADYEIDYDSHSLFFKFPVPSRDAHLNPNFIVVDYESESSAKKSVAVSGRIAWLTDDGKTEIGMSLIHEKDDQGINGDLIGTDITYKLDEETEIKAEFAHSQSQDSGNAWLLEARKHSETLTGRAYIRQQDSQFGLEQQNLNERGTRKYGADGRYQLKNQTYIQGDIYRQENLDNNNQRDQASLEFGRETETSHYAIGIRHAKELTNSQTRQGTLLTLGGSVTPDNGRVTLRTHIEKNIGNKNGANEAYPDRLIIGADVGLTDDVALFLEREITRSDEVNTSIDRIGLSSKLWEGASVKSSINREHQYAGDRTFATLGLAQHLNLTEQLSADLSVDHAKTLKNTQQEPIDSDQSAINGSIRDDFTAFAIGLGWRDDIWSWTTRLENRNGDLEDKQNLRFGFIRHLSKDKDFSARIDVTRSQLNTGDENNLATISLGSAWHPQKYDYTILQRLDYKQEQVRSDGDNKRSRKLIHNLHINKKAGKKTQISLHHGLKHTLEDEFNEAYNATVDTAQLQVRRNVSEKVDVGIHAGYLHDWENDNWQYNYGGSVGLTPAENMWLSVGYNLEGFSDKDFEQSEYTAQGPYLQLRYRADKDQLSKITDNQQKKAYKDKLSD